MQIDVWTLVLIVIVSMAAGGITTVVTLAWVAAKMAVLQAKKTDQEAACTLLTR
jgi:hypothetical protein